MELFGIHISNFLIVVVPSAGIERIVVAIAAWRKKRHARAELPPGSD